MTAFKMLYETTIKHRKQKYTPNRLMMMFVVSLQILARYLTKTRTIFVPTVSSSMDAESNILTEGVSFLHHGRAFLVHSVLRYGYAHEFSNSSVLHL